MAIYAYIHKMISALIGALLVVFVLLPIAGADSGPQPPLVLGVAELPPFAMKGVDGLWQGLGVELWREAAAEMGVVFQIREYRRTRQVTAALILGEIDVSCIVPVTEENEIAMDLTHAYHRTGLDIAVSSDKGGLHWVHIARNISYASIVVVIAVLVGMSLVAGILIWLLEKKSNPQMFGGHAGKGLGHGLWWALVTMTTVGYGDKAPKTSGGRIVAVVWMFISVSCIAGYTAVITSALTVSELGRRISGPQDLPRVHVGALSRSETMDILAARGVVGTPFKDLQSGLQAVIDDRIDAFVDNQAQLAYLVRSRFPGRLQMPGTTFEHYYMAMGLPTGSPLREPLNRAIVKLTAQESWTQLTMKYLGRIE